MQLKEAIEYVENYQRWRRGAEIEQPNPTKLGIAIDILIENVKRIKSKKIVAFPVTEKRFR